MDHKKNTEETGELLRLTLNFMMQHKIPVTPDYYYVCYEYTSGANHKLKTVMDRILETRGTFSENLLDDLYKNFIADYHCIVQRETTEEVREILKNLMSGMSDTEGDIFSSTKRLTSVAHTLKTESSLDEIKRIAMVMTSTAAGLASSGKQMHDQLRQATNEIEELRKKLEKTREQSITDPLTGLVNRRGMTRFLERDMETAKKTSDDLCLMVADIDHFKNINDTYGHLVGDNVLKLIASTLDRHVDDNDCAVRYGGEEFLIILPSRSLDNAYELAERVRTALESVSWKEKRTGKSMGQITLSLGLALMRPDDSMESLIARADQALYHSKQNGRNRTSTEKHLNG